MTYIPKFNYCSSLLTKKIYDSDNYLVLSVRKIKKQDVNKLHQHNFISPSIKIFSTDKPKFKSLIRRYGPRARPVVLEKNNLAFYSTKKDGKIIEWKIGVIGVEMGKFNLYTPCLHELEVDKANKRLRLFGKRCFQGWINIDKF